MSTLRVANVHFDSTGTNRINYLDDNTLRFHTNGVERVTIGSSGNFGIGTNNPTNLLELSGGNFVQYGNAFYFLKQN